MIETLRKRRSIRRYKDMPIESAKVELIKESLLRAPSSRGLKPWEFVFVDDRELLDQLARAKPHGSAFVAGAALAVVVCGDEARCDVWIEDCSIAALLVHLTACSLDLGSCWVQIRMRNHDESTTAESYVRDLLGIPEELHVEAIVAVGYPDEEKPPHLLESLEREKIYTNGYGKP